MVHISIAFRSHVLSNPAVRALWVWAVLATKFSGHESLRSLRLGPPQTSRELHQCAHCSGVTSGRCCFRDYMQHVTLCSRLGGPFMTSLPGWRISLHCALSFLYLQPNKLAIEWNLNFIHLNLSCGNFTHILCPAKTVIWTLRSVIPIVYIRTTVLLLLIQPPNTTIC